jgi:hypothetical protein
MSTSRIIKLRDMVLHILKEYPQSRDSDIWLTIKLWTIYYPTRITRNEAGVQVIALKDIIELPREDNVKRVRAKIQNEEHLYLPNSLEVAQQRHINMEDWRNWANNQTRCE